MLFAALFPLAWAQETPAEELVWEYEGPGGARLAATHEVMAAVLASPALEHRVRGNGVADWTPWQQVPVLAEVWLMTRTGAAAEPAAPKDVSKDAADPLQAGSKVVHWSETKTVVPGWTKGGFRVRVGADIRVDFSASNLQDAGAADGGTTAGFSVSRARPIIDAFGGVVSARLAIEARLSSVIGVSADGESTDPVSYWDVRGREVWLAFSGGDTFHHAVTVGLQEPAFGVRRTFEERYPFAGAARADLARKRGVIHDEDIGIGWNGASEHWTFDVQVLNGNGGDLDVNTGKDFLVRVEASPIPALAVSASGLLGMRGEDGSEQQSTGEVAVEVRGPHQRLVAEGLIGTLGQETLDDLGFGGAVTGFWSFPMLGVLSDVSFVGRAMYLEPVLGIDAPDAWWGSGAGAWLGWAAPTDHDVRTGVTWEMNVPQDSRLPVTHDVVAEAAWQF